MRNKKIIVAILISLLILAPIIVMATKDIIMYDEQGRVIIYAGEERPEGIPEDAETAFVIHKESEQEIQARKEKEYKEALLEKENFEANLKTSNTLIEESEPMSEEELNTIKSLLTDRNFEEEAKIVLKKYYGNSKIDNLFKDLQEKTSIKKGGSLISDYTIPDSGIELIRLMFDIIDIKDSSDEEKNSIINYLKTIEPLGIRNDDELKTKLVELNK